MTNLPDLPPSRLLLALVSGTATVAYYASPDVIASRTARGWVKAGLAVLLVATAVPDARATIDEVRRTRREAEAGSDAPGPLDAPGRDPSRQRATAAAVGAGAAVLAAAAGLVGGLAIERRIFRRGQARAAAGRRWAHTRPALVLGVVAAGLSLIPTPAERGSSGADG